VEKKLLFGTAAALILVMALLGCQTAKPALVTPAESAIQVEKSGFSPAGAAGQNSIDFSLLFGNGDAIKFWKVELSNDGKTQKSWSGDSKYLPASLNWDGKSDGGSISPERTYTAKLSIDYTAKYQSVSEQSKSFVLDVTPPTGTITMDPSEFTPTESGVTGPMIFTIDAHSALAHMDSWSLDVLDAAGGLVKNWSGQWAQDDSHLGWLIDERRVCQPLIHLPGYRHGARRVWQQLQAESHCCRGGPPAEGT
jgi:hypothetical protein